MMEEYEKNFMEAVYPEHTAVAAAINSEKTVIMDATDKIESLQTENTTLKGKLAEAEDIIKGVIDDDPYTNHFAKEYTRKHPTPPTKEG
jgi:predicted RNase H-like nuclease (RuvC/YqgF family)